MDQNLEPDMRVYLGFTKFCANVTHDVRGVNIKLVRVKSEP